MLGHRAAMDDHLGADVGVRLEQHRVHVGVRRQPTGLGLDRLGAADLAAVGGDRAVQRHVLRLERHHARRRAGPASGTARVTRVLLPASEVVPWTIRVRPRSLMSRLPEAEQRGIQPGPGSLVGGQAEAQAGRLLELAGEDAAPRQVVVQRRAAWIDQALEQRAAARRRASRGGAAVPQALAGGQQALALLARCCWRSRKALWTMATGPLTVHGPSCSASACNSGRSPRAKPSRAPGQAEELAERARSTINPGRLLQAARPDCGCSPRTPRRPAASRRDAAGAVLPGQQLGGLEDPPGGVVRADHQQHVEAVEIGLDPASPISRTRCPAWRRRGRARRSTATGR